MGQDVKLSVALVTRNRPESLERTLLSLRAQDVQPYEVVVSDDSGTDYRDETKKIALKHDCHYIEGPHRGLYANRNYSALHCSGTHVRTMDDDHTFPDGHIAACLTAIASRPECIWVISEFLSHNQYSGTSPKPGQYNPRGFAEPPIDSERCWAIADGSTIFPKTIFDDGIRYVEFFKFGSVFYELGSRLFSLGYKIQLLSETHIIHHSQEFEQQGNTVWSDCPDTSLASRYFTMLCHSFIYQRNFRNIVATTAQILRDLLFLRRSSSPALRVAVKAYKIHCKIFTTYLSNNGRNLRGVSQRSR